MQHMLLFPAAWRCVCMVVVVGGGGGGGDLPLGSFFWGPRGASLSQCTGRNRGENL
eukprot:COSAG06_NODE_447_length_15632_cov_47.212193_1_plen_55_part_10